MADRTQSGQETICPDHPDKTIELWCKTCEELACAKCWPLKHNGTKHVLVDVKEAANDLSTAFLSELESIQLSLTPLIEKGKEMKIATEQIDIGAMTKSFKRFREMLDRQENLLKLHIAELEGANQRLVENYQRQLESNQEHLQQQKQLVQSIMAENEYVQLLQAKEQLSVFAKQTMEDLDQLKPPKRVKYEIPGLNELNTFTNELSQKMTIVSSTPELDQTVQSATRPRQKLSCSSHSYNIISISR